MSFLSNLSGAVLRKAADLKDKILSMEAELAELLKADAVALGYTGAKPSGGKRKGMSAAGRAKIAAAQKLRWKKANAAKASKPVVVTKLSAKPVVKRKMSAAARAKIAVAAKARWAKVKAEGKSTL
jgi:hypothetical protein